MYLILLSFYFNYLRFCFAAIEKFAVLIFVIKIYQCFVFHVFEFLSKCVVVWYNVEELSCRSADTRHLSTKMCSGTDQSCAAAARLCCNVRCSGMIIITVVKHPSYQKRSRLLPVLLRSHYGQYSSRVPECQTILGFTAVWEDGDTWNSEAWAHHLQLAYLGLTLVGSEC